MQKDVEEIRSQIRSVLREVNDLITDIERNSLPEGTHALASALRSRIDDLGGAIDGVLDPGQVIGRSVRAPQPAASGLGVGAVTSTSRCRSTWSNDSGRSSAAYCASARRSLSRGGHLRAL